MKKLLLLTLSFVCLSMPASAIEGMWIPSLIEMFHSDMQTYGLKLTAEQVYATNQASLKDGIVQFDGGCTAEIVSDQGLLLTNHHCGLGEIQHHSSVEKDYIKNGFWAKSQKEELACPWIRVTFVKEIKEVTTAVLKGTAAAKDAKEKATIIRANIKALTAEYENSPFIKAVIKPFNKGNHYFMLVTEDFRDVRLVGAPPMMIGAYGGDTDNWVWPRHSGDFSVFRIYANKENKAAEYSEENQPYKPKHFLPINIGDKQKGDFTMVYGFPGSTDQHYSSDKLAFYMQKERPARIKMRQTTLDILKPAMLSDDKIRIQYTSKKGRIANAWKKWIGQLGGLNELKALDKKQAWEKAYTARAATKEEWKKYSTVIKDMQDLYKDNQKYEFARSMFIEYFYVGPEFMRFVRDFEELAFNYDTLVKDSSLDETIKKLEARTAGFFKNYNRDLDHKIYNALSPLYLEYVEDELEPKGWANNWKKTGDDIFKKSIFLQPAKLKALLSKMTKGGAKKLQKDPALKLSTSFFNNYLEKVQEGYATAARKEAALLQLYVDGIIKMFPDKKLWSDANSTMRIAYGKIDGSAPVDGMQYLHYTTIDGVMQKYDPDNPDFVLPARYVKLYKEGDWGDYAQDGELWVCFTASNHTTGGNSGSPVIDANGRLIGINFDRSWESTMSDFMFDESRCRNIVVDIRYVLWVIDKYGEAGYLIEEMKLEK